MDIFGVKYDKFVWLEFDFKWEINWVEFLIEKWILLFGDYFIKWCLF